jgi:hypothetical protein
LWNDDPFHSEEDIQKKPLLEQELTQAHFSTQAMEAVFSMLVKDPSLRPTLSQVLQLPFLDG